MAERARAGWLAALVGGAALVALVWVVVPRGEERRPASPPPRAGEEASPERRPPMPPQAPSSAAAPAPAAPAPEADPPAAILDPDDAAALAWSSVDLDEVRDALPDNLYWQMSVPTDDPEVLERRREERDRWNAEYGKVLSGTATDEEIDAYFALRQRISQDAVSFTDYLLLNHAADLPERDVALLALAGRLHRARLEELPKRMAEAIERKQLQDTLRESWLADERAFEPARAPSD